MPIVFVVRLYLISQVEVLHTRRSNILIVALIGVICEVEDDAVALSILEALRIPTCVPLVLKYQKLKSGKYQVCDLPDAEECTIEYFDGPGPAELPPIDLGHPKLPVWPLNSCIPVQGIFQKDVIVQEVPTLEGALRK